MPLSQLVRPTVMRGERPAEEHEHQQPEAMSDASSGMMTTGIRPRSQRGTVHAADPQCGEAGEQAADDAAEEAGADEHGDRAGGEARRDAGPVGDGEGDVAGQRGDQEAEGQRRRS